jgi:hypothetical protein
MITDMPKETKSPEAALLTLLEDAAVPSFHDRLQEMLDSQTFVGGKRVTKQKLLAAPRNAATTVHVVKVSLFGAKPPVWRRLEIPSAMPLNELHQVLQAAFEWDDYHLHQFETVCGEYGDPAHNDDWSERDDESAVTLAQVATAQRAKVVYVYDFGDDWRHDIVVEKILPAEPGASYPRCTGGKGDAPEEDSGGVWVFNAERAEDGVRNGQFDADQVTGNLTALADVVVPVS